MFEHKKNRYEVDEINRLHREVVRMSEESRERLHIALESAWQAGQLLIEKKSRVRRTMGSGAWQLWLGRYFASTPRTAQRYMLLAKNVSDVSAFRGLSLRQVYFRLGIATEPKSATQGFTIPPMPRHIGLSNKLLGFLQRSAQLPPERLANYQRDLRPLYERLCSLFK